MVLGCRSGKFEPQKTARLENSEQNVRYDCENSIEMENRGDFGVAATVSML